MKSLKSNLMAFLCLIFTGSIALQSCESETNQITSQENNIPEVVYDSYVDGIKLPDGTKVEKVDHSTVNFTYPKGYELWTLGENDNIEKRMASSYTCSCSSSGGCDVFYVRGNFGCSHGSCSGSCTGKHGKDKILRKVNAAFVNMEQGIQKIQSNEEHQKLEVLPSFILKDEGVQTQLKNFARELYGEQYMDAIKKVEAVNSSRSSSEVEFVVMKMLGYKFVYAISTNDLKPSYGKVSAFMRMASHSCKCDSGNSGCTKKSSMGVKYCKGGSCSTCTMSMGKVMR